MQWPKFSALFIGLLLSMSVQAGGWGGVPMDIPMRNPQPFAFNKPDKSILELIRSGKSWAEMEKDLEVDDSEKNVVGDLLSQFYKGLMAPDISQGEDETDPWEEEKEAIKKAIDDPEDFSIDDLSQSTETTLEVKNSSASVVERVTGGTGGAGKA